MPEFWSFIGPGETDIVSPVIAPGVAGRVPMEDFVELDRLLDCATDDPDEAVWMRRANLNAARKRNIERGRATRAAIYGRYIALGRNPKAIVTIAAERGCSARAIREHLQKYRQQPLT